MRWSHEFSDARRGKRARVANLGLKRQNYGHNSFDFALLSAYAHIDVG